MGKPMWYVAPMRPVKQTKHAEIVYPIQTQIHAKNPVSQTLLLSQLGATNTLPPGESDLKRRRSNHPCVDIEGIGNPETNKIPRLPLSTLRLNGLEIEVGQEQLLVRQTGLSFHFLAACELVLK